MAGGQVPGGATLTQIDAFIPSTGKVSTPACCPRPTPSPAPPRSGPGQGSRRVHGGRRGGRAGGPDQAGVASGSLQSVISLRLSPYGGPAGRPGAGVPLLGHAAHRRPGQRPADRPRRRPQTHLAVPVGHHAPAARWLLLPRRRLLHPGGTGIISNQEDNHTIVEIGYPSGKILWQYGHPGQPGAAPGYLDQPDDAYLLKSGAITVADASNNRILFISPAGPGRRPDRQRCRRPRPAHLHRLSQRGHPAGRRERPGLGDQRLVGRRVHAGGPAGVDRAHPDRQLPLRSPAGRPEPLPDDRLRPAGRGPRPRVHPSGPGHLALRRPVR